MADIWEEGCCSYMGRSDILEIPWTRYENASSDIRVKYQKSADSIVVTEMLWRLEGWWHLAKSLMYLFMQYR